VSLSRGASELAHRGSHRSLLAPLGRPSGRSLDAIVVPASRPAENLLPAMVLAAEVGAVFVSLCSGAAKRRAVASCTREVPGLRYAVVPVPAGFATGLLDFRTSTVGRARIRRLGDLSLKRNLGLLLGRLAGWRTLLFLDDDIHKLDQATVRRAVMAVPSGGAVGLPATKYPDNSVICHARREVGLPQDVFVSGSALAVDCEHIDSFFPDVYNEDWLFLADALRRGAVSAAGESKQVAYDPFASPQRAEAEEFGDVLAEGLIGLLHAGGSFAAGVDHWADVLQQRKELIADVEGRLDRLCADSARKVLDSLRAAERRLAAIEGYDLVSYVRYWRADLDTWRRRLRRLPRHRPLPEALSLLGLRQHAVLSAEFEPAVAKLGPVGPVVSGLLDPMVPVLS
jgi:hypothetical protein